MRGNLLLRIITTLVIGAAALVLLLPSLPFSKSWPMPGFLAQKEINLGLDLKGGIHLTLEVDLPKAIENSLSQAGQELRSLAREDGLQVLQPKIEGYNRLTFDLLKPEQQAQVDELISRSFGHMNLVSKQEQDGRIKYVLEFKKEQIKTLQDLTITQAIKTIRNRIDQFGVTEPDIRKQQSGRIQVQLPGLDDPERAIQLVQQTAHLEFQMVDRTVDPETVTEQNMPRDVEILPLRRLQPDGTYAETPIALKSEVLLTGEYITDARVSYDSYGQPYVNMTFNSRGARIFERVTGEHVGEQLAIVLDDKVYSAPNIKSKISGGRAVIEGRFTPEEAHDLAVVLRSGSLPAPIKVAEERHVGPSLGQESIDKGVTSALLGGAFVVVFMVVHYGFAGLVADLALGLNIVLIMAGLALFGATLTLPGIAGIILTIGMAVDANVIIFERIREELRRGLTARAAVAEGYSRATLTILDANVTTVIAAIILYEFGTGPIRGFAVTLSLGIVASMFTAIFVSRILFDLWLASRKSGAVLKI